MIKTLKYINLEYSDKDIDYIDYICERINEESEYIVDFFEVSDFNDKVNAKIYANLSDFRDAYEKYFKRKPNNWICGFATKDKNIYTLSLEEYRKTDYHENATIEDLIQLIIHEFTHAVHMKRNNNVSTRLWLTEGAATYLSGQNKNANEFDCSYEQLINKFAPAPYKYYKLMFEYVFNTYGKDYILKLVDDEELLANETERLFYEAKDFYYKKSNGDIYGR